MVSTLRLPIPYESDYHSLLVVSRTRLRVLRFGLSPLVMMKLGIGME